MNKQIEQLALDIHSASHLPLELCEALATDIDKKGYRKMPESIGDFSDGYHTFNELYHHRAVLFSVICNMFPDKAWKSKLHDTGEMFDGMFIVGIETEQGQATYHYDIDHYWDMFKVKELERAPKYDGHSPYDAIDRIGNLSTKGYRKQSEGGWVVTGTERAWNNAEYPIERSCSVCGLRRNIETQEAWNFCPNCGAKMKGDEGK